MTNYWIHVEIPNPGFDQVISMLGDKHHEAHPSNDLSITYNVASDEAIVKVTADDAWMQANVTNRPWEIRTYNDADHSELFSFFYTPAWQEAV